MKAVGPRPCCYHDIRAAVSASLRRGSEGYRAKLLNVIGIQALDIALRIRHRRFVGVYSVDGHIVGAVARPEHIGRRPGASSALQDSWLEGQQA